MDIRLTALSSCSNSASEAFTVLRTPVKADSNSMLDCIAAVPSASTGAVTTVESVRPIAPVVLLTESQYLEKSVMDLPAAVHREQAVSS